MYILFMIIMRNFFDIYEHHVILNILSYQNYFENSMIIPVKYSNLFVQVQPDLNHRNE